MAKLRVVVLMGGKSPEHEVSLATGAEVIKNLDKKKYQIGEDGTIQGMLELVGVPYLGAGVLASALKKAFLYSSQLLIEEYLPGIEVSCGILGNREPKALPIAEIIPRNEFFDYEAKYTPGKSTEVVPARISKKLTRAVQALAVKVFQAIGCRGRHKLSPAFGPLN